MRRRKERGKRPVFFNRCPGKEGEGEDLMRVRFGQKGGGGGERQALPFLPISRQDKGRKRTFYALLVLLSSGMERKKGEGKKRREKSCLLQSGWAWQGGKKEDGRSTSCCRPKTNFPKHGRRKLGGRRNKTNPLSEMKRNPALRRHERQKRSRRVRQIFHLGVKKKEDRREKEGAILPD